MKRIMFIFFLLMNLAQAQDEFTPLGTFNPDFFAELLDVEVYSPTRIYTVGVGGFVFIDDSDPTKLNLIGRFSPGSIYKRFYNGIASAGLALGAARGDGLYILDIRNMKQPLLYKIHKTTGYFYESVALKDGIAYAAVHKKGVEVLDLHDPEQPRLLLTIDQFENVWDVFVNGEFLYVADGRGGIKTYALTDPRNPVFISSLSTTAQAKEIIVQDEMAYIALGAAGFDIVNLANPAKPSLVSNFNPGFGITNHLDYQDGIVYLSAWEMVMAVDVKDPTNPFLIATEDTPGRAMGIAAGNGNVYVSDWFTVKSYDFQSLIQPDIHVKPAVQDFGFKALGESISQEFKVFNLGEAELNISKITIDTAQFSLDKSTLSIKPNSSEKITITYLANNTSNISKTVLFHSDDPDEPEFDIRLYAGSSRLSPGDPAPAFTLDDIDGNRFSLDDFRGKIVLLAFFASW